MNLVLMAQYFATVEHVIKRQQTYGVLPYTHHLQDTADVLTNFGIRDEEYLAAAWLHDVIEDCPGVKAKHVMEMFGPLVTSLVVATTKTSVGSRKEKTSLEYYAKIRETLGGVVVKLADRISNVSHGGPMFEMYQKEYPDFRRSLRSSLISPAHQAAVAAMWSTLDSILGYREE